MYEVDGEGNYHDPKEYLVVTTQKGRIQGAWYYETETQATRAAEDLVSEPLFDVELDDVAVFHEDGELIWTAREDGDKRLIEETFEQILKKLGCVSRT